MNVSGPAWSLKSSGGGLQGREMARGVTAYPIPQIPCATAAPEGQYLCSNAYKPEVPGPAGRYLGRNDAGARRSGRFSIRQDTGPMGRETVFVCNSTKILPLRGSDHAWNLWGRVQPVR
jgi:hypothetical protein